MKGILLSGGLGTRLYPITRSVSKQLLPVYNKPMIYYPLSALMLAGIQEVLLISTPDDIGGFKRLLGDGSALGLKMRYAVQEKPAGIAQAFLVGKDFIGKDPVALALGDNIFYGQGLTQHLRAGAQLTEGALIFGYWVRDPERYGVLEFDAQGLPVGIEEKPAKPKSSFAVPGIYFYDNQVVPITEGLKPSKRGELEITDVNLEYLRRRKMKVEILGRGIAWLDTGTPESLLQASTFIQAIEERQGLRVACLEEIALKQNFLSKDEFRKIAESYPGTYGDYLKSLLA
ncbi:MAG TPA: glucose-1-phosphate thymidylyltransferase RfbA [bacterium]|nr:glucose-1-phosphate thymidylyltransferase RfbA [bacterium]